MKISNSVTAQLSQIFVKVFFFNCKKSYPFLYEVNDDYKWQKDAHTNPGGVMKKDIPAQFFGVIK